MIEHNNTANTNLFFVIYKKRKLLFLTTTIAIAIASIVTILTPKKYQSIGTIYGINTNSFDFIIENPSFGDEEDADQLIQLFESNTIKDKIIAEFNLVQYYQIDTNNPAWQYYLYENYTSDITFNRTRFSSVNISATTKNPKLSANIVNRLMELIDEQRESIYKSNTNLIVTNYQKQYEEKNQQVSAILDTLYNLTGGNSTTSNNALFNNRKMFMDERQKNTHIYPGDAGIKNISNANETLEVEKLINEYYFLQGRLNYIKEKLDVAKTKQQMPLAKVYKISSAKPNYKKASPKLSINLIVFTSLSLVLTILFILVKDQLAKNKK